MHIKTHPQVNSTHRCAKTRHPSENTCSQSHLPQITGPSFLCPHSLASTFPVRQDTDSAARDPSACRETAAALPSVQARRHACHTYPAGPAASPADPSSQHQAPEPHAVPVHVGALARAAAAAAAAAAAGSWRRERVRWARGRCRGWQNFRVYGRVAASQDGFAAAVRCKRVWNLPCELGSGWRGGEDGKGCR